MRTISFNSPNEASKYCLNKIKKIIEHDYNILYIGYSNSDFILNWLHNNCSNITIIDKNMEFAYEDRNIIRNDILNLNNDFIKTFDVIILSFILHENNYMKQVKILNKVNENSKNIIIIEPLKIHQKYSRKIQEKILKNNHLKKYYADELFYSKRLENIKEIEVLKCKNVNIKIDDSIIKLELPNLLFCHAKNKLK